MEPELRRWASRHGDRVRICTDVHHEEVPQYLNATDVLCLPSQTAPHWREQFGRVLIEAFACGVPVIGSSSGEIPHVLRNTGVVVHERDETAWGEAIADLLSNPSRRKELAEQGLERAHQEFTWPVVASQYLDFFEQLLDDR
jgi:glycosyltransferase involved in cell wall biosynthesis